MVVVGIAANDQDRFALKVKGILKGGLMGVGVEQRHMMKDFERSTYTKTNGQVKQELHKFSKCSALGWRLARMMKKRVK